MTLAEQLRELVKKSRKSLIELERITGVDRSTLSVLRRGGKVSDSILMKLKYKLIKQPEPAKPTVFTKAMEREKTGALPSHAGNGSGKGTTWYVGAVKPDEWVEYVPKRSTKPNRRVTLTERGELVIPHSLAVHYLLYEGTRVNLFYNTTKHQVAIVRPKNGRGTVQVADASGTAGHERAVKISAAGLLAQVGETHVGSSKLSVVADPTMLIVNLKNKE